MSDFASHLHLDKHMSDQEDQQLRMLRDEHNGGGMGGGMVPQHNGMGGMSHHAGMMGGDSMDHHHHQQQQQHVSVMHHHHPHHIHQQQQQHHQQQQHQHMAVAHATHMGNPSLATNAMIMSALQQQMLHLQDLEQANALSSMPMSLALPANMQAPLTVTPHHAGHGTMAAMMYMRDHPAAAAAMAAAAAAAAGAGGNDEESSSSRRWRTRIEASEAIKSYVAAQGYRAMVDRHNKGGSAVTFRCSSAVKEGSNCSLLIRLRKSKKHNDWYIAGRFCLTHTCHQPHAHAHHMNASGENTSTIYMCL